METISKKGGKKVRAARLIVGTDVYTAQDALEKIRAISFVKFDPTVEVVLKLGVDPKHSDQMVRGMVVLPHGTGKSVRVAVICKDERFDIARAAGADIVGGIDVIDTIKSGKIEFDVCIATPDMMGVVGQVARILGPKGLMPNPKLGTVSTDIETAVKNAKSGQVEFRVDKGGIIHAGIGKLSFSSEHLFGNLKALRDAVLKAKPAAAKGAYMQGMFLSATMSPAVKVDMASV